MTTVAILPIFDADGEKTYRAIAGDKHSVGKTAGQALDALTTQLGETEFSAMFIIQNFSPDPFFSAKQQKRLSELMSLWRLGRDHGQALPPELQAELDTLVEAELIAATARTAALIHQEKVNTQSGKIMGITSPGKVTIEYLEMNSASQVAARQLWIRLGLFP